MQDKELLSAIREGGRAKRLAVDHLFNSHIGMMQTVQSKLHLSADQIKDMYADTISATIWNIDTNRFKGESKLSSYLYRILYNKSVDLLRHTTTNKNVAYLELAEESSALISEDQDRILESSLDVQIVKSELFYMGNPCSNIIMDWAFWGYDMAEIASRNNLENADKAKKKKYSCMKKLRLLLKSKGISDL
ncbi:RNA polymerase sigma factor [Portibacter lacus]|uniref:RNA polymerase sigma-70 region 2 domain-containing protein n=1 Tax=Portibacter lacus TaxID=1099794 RepID=A0AA37STU9_9BACT|nr:hypothetical protein [Portibacter lacus]GLR19534.1 hypothetical protein GCM10007940_41500 [Portibacter lacus]